MGGEKSGQALMRGIGLGDDEQARGVLVEPVDDAGAANSANARKALAAMSDESVDQGS